MRSTLLIVFAMALLTACSDSATTPDSSGFDSGDVARSISEAAAGGFHTLDDVFVAVNDGVPWFAGLFVEGEHVVLLATDLLAAQAESQLVFEGILEAINRPDLRSKSLVLREAGYSFHDLSRFRSRASAVASDHQVHFLDIDEVSNKIVLHTIAEEHRASLSRGLGAAGIPANARSVDVQPPPQLEAVRGGEGIGVLKRFSVVEDCTLNQVVTRSGETSLYAITNSHCTTNLGYDDDDRIVYYGTIQADEHWDHPFITDARCQAFTNSTGALCRYSDAVLFKYRSTVQDLNPHQILADNAVELDYERRFVLAGDLVNKTGRSTGLTSGKVTETCADRAWEAGKSLLCQYGADYKSTGGDSGAPVWLLESGVRYYAGIHWGGPLTKYFSPASAVAQEINPSGEWNTCLSHNSMYCTY